MCSTSQNLRHMKRKDNIFDAKYDAFNISKYNRLGPAFKFTFTRVTNEGGYLTNKYKLICPEGLDHVRCGFEEDKKTIYFVDPPGGPFMVKGKLMPGTDNVIIDHFDVDGGIFAVLKLKEDDLPSDKSES